jgi:hypothetical protein
MDWYGNGLGRWITYYNTQRPHSGLAGRTPVEAYGWIGQSDHGGQASAADRVWAGERPLSGVLARIANTPPVASTS